MPEILHFKSLKDSLKDPQFFISDFAKFDRPPQLHLCFCSLDDYIMKYGRLPRPHHEQDAADFSIIVNVSNKASNEPIDISEMIVKEFAYQAQGDIPAMNAVVGGLVAQEMLKACSGKFTPLQQFFYFDSLESLPTSSPRSQEFCAPQNSPYDGQIAVFGSEFQKKIGNARQFLVGSGAIGCEMLKNWALMGLGVGPEGAVYVTDMDTIEKSNLNRQFLFRPWDVKKLKSECAVEAIQKMNSETIDRYHAFADRVGGDTENIFNDAFWNKLSGVTNALDNVDARKYVDRRCVFFRKPLLESGTLGTKGNTQVVLPHLTESYSSSNDPPEKSIPLCTLKSFPNAIEHTIQVQYRVILVGKGIICRLFCSAG